METALAAPLVLVLLLGVIEWGYYFDQQSSVAAIALDAAGAGSRVLSTANPTGVAHDRAVDALASAGFSTADAVVTTSTGVASAGATISVTITLPYEPISGIVPSPAFLRGAATVRKQVD